MHDLGDGQSVASHLGRLDGDLDLALAAAIDVHLADPGHALQPVLDHVLDEVAELVDRALVALGPGDDEPGDGVVLAAGGLERGLVGLVGIAGHPVQPVGDQQQGAAHIGADIEFERHPTASLLGLAGDVGEAGNAGQDLFLLVGDFPLHLCRGGAGPVRGHADDRPVDVGRELDRDGVEGDQAEHHHHQDRGDHGDGPLDRGPDRVHHEAPSICTWAPGVRRSLPRVTTISPSSRPLRTSSRSPRPSPISMVRGSALSSLTT